MPELYKIGECYVCKSNKVKFYKEVNGFGVAKCYNCGLLWVIGVDKDDIEPFYNRDYFFNNSSKMGYKNYLADEENHRKNAKHILVKVNQIKDFTNAKILDIGCAFGFLLDEVRRYKACDVYGVEINRYACEYASKELNLTNISDYQDYRNFESGFFDIVFLIGTIEHLISPKETLSNISRVLKRQGLLVITTLDTKGLIPLYSIKPPEHTFYFNHDNILLLLNQLSFKCLLREAYFVNYYLYDLCYRVGEFLSLSILDNLPSIIKKFLNVSIKIPTNEMIIIAEKL